MGSDQPLTLCVLLWAHAGRQDALVDYEDTVLQLLPAHGGRVLQRGRTDGADGAPFEIHLLAFPSEAALDAYMLDPQRVALTSARDAAIARTEIHRVTLV